MKKKVAIPSKFGARNVWCRDYSQCLDRAIESGAAGFSCHGCHLEHDHSGVPKDTTDLKEDAAVCMALVISVFKRINAQEALGRVI